VVAAYHADGTTSPRLCGGHHKFRKGYVMPELIKEFEIHPDVKIDEIDVVGLGPFGLRMISNVTGGEIVGNRLKGTIVGPGGDWVLVGLDGFARIDVRLTFKTVDGR
jgi:Protein of unknown function (DUF3237)